MPPANEKKIQIVKNQTLGAISSKYGYKFLNHPGMAWESWGAFHLVKNSENSGSGLNGKRFFGSPDRKIPRKSVTTGTTF